MPKQTAANNDFLKQVKTRMNAPTYKCTLETVNAKGEDAARQYLQQFFRTPVDEVFPKEEQAVMIETTTQDFPLKIKARRQTIELLEDSAAREGNAAVQDVLGRYRSQILVNDEGERRAVRQHISDAHGVGSTNGMPKNQRTALASLIHELGPNPQPKEEEVTQQDAPQANPQPEEEEVTQQMVEDMENGYPPEDTAARARAKEEARRADERWAADQLLKRGELSRELRDAVHAGEIALDEAKANFAIEQAVSKAEEPRRAKGNPERKAPEKGEQAPKPKPEPLELEPLEPGTSYHPVAAMLEVVVDPDGTEHYRVLMGEIEGEETIEVDGNRWSYIQSDYATRRAAKVRFPKRAQNSPGRKVRANKSTHGIDVMPA